MVCRMKLIFSILIIGIGILVVAASEKCINTFGKPLGIIFIFLYTILTICFWLSIMMNIHEMEERRKNKDNSKGD